MAAALSIEYRVGDATRPTGDGPKVVAHICNDIGAWGKGFVLALSKRWTEPEAVYRRWFADRATNDFRLGSVRLVQVEPDIWVANIIGQRGIRRGSGGPPVRYDAIEEALSTVADQARTAGASVHMPRIGCGLAGGDWKIIAAIVERKLSATHVPVVVYDLP
ncbi:MAG: Appr-1-p processing protein [Acidimicrobiales bacterium]|nr:MAG: Appr-1-p processing protein [Acidimicrobiales bacterium]